MVWSSCTLEEGQMLFLQNSHPNSIKQVRQNQSKNTKQTTKEVGNAHGPLLYLTTAKHSSST
jgi:hypothetical protein